MENNTSPVRVLWNKLSTLPLPEAEGLLSAQKENLSQRDETGLSLLHMAAAEGRTEITTLLVRAGAVLNPRDALGETPLDCAVNHGFDDTALYLRQCGAKHGAQIDAEEKPAKDCTLHDIIYRGELKNYVEDVLNKTRPALKIAELTAANAQGETPLNLAQRQGVLKHLLDARLWEGRGKDFITLLGHVPEEVQKEHGCDDILRNVRQKSLGSARRKNRDI